VSRLALPVLLFISACATPPDGAGVDQGSADLAVDASPYQSCSNGLASTHLEGPELTMSSTAPTTVRPLVLFSGPRSLSRTLGPELRRCLDTAGCLALARIGALGSRTWQELGRLGLHRVEHLQGRHVIVAMKKGAELRAAMDAGLVEAVDVLRPSDKLPPEQPFDVGRVALLADERGRVRTRSFRRLGLPLSPAGERAAARRRWVFRIAAERTPEGWLDADVRRSIRTDPVQGFSLGPQQAPIYSGYTGAGIVAAVVDSGVDPGHLDLHALDASGKPTSTRVEGAPDTIGHGTAVASVLAGNGLGSAGFSLEGTKSGPFQWRGQAPRALEIVSLYKGTPWGSAVPRAHLFNHSYPLSYGTYDNATAFVDQAIHVGLTHEGASYPPRPMVWAAGNAGLVAGAAGAPAGYHSTSAVAKNPIVVGGSNANDDSFCPWASHGPTHDGRIKPDVVAPYTKDFRPPGGIPTTIDEIRLVARDGAGATDRVWSFEKDGDLEGWKASPGIEQVAVKGGALEALVTLGGKAKGVAPPPLVGGGTLTRAGLSLDGGDYERLELRMRVLVDEGSGRYRYPNLLGVRWDNDADADLDHSRLAPFESAKRDSGWHTHAVDLPATFKGTIKALQIEPAAYLHGIVVAVAKTQTYQVAAGTSYAAPAVSGVVALLLEQYVQEREANLQVDPPWPSTLKALLIHTARDLVHETADARDRDNPDTGAPTVFHQGPDFATGWGLVDALAASRLLAASSAKERKLAQAKIGSGQVHSYRVLLSDRVAVKTLRATLVWDDPPGSPVLAKDQPRLVNDLDLTAVGPSATTHGPWVLDPLPSSKAGIKPSDVKPARRCAAPSGSWKAKGCEDHLNNVEQVAVARPEHGLWTIRVRARDVPRGPQRYSLVVSASCE
jgi:subtilisin family serine protease